MLPPTIFRPQNHLAAKINRDRDMEDSDDDEDQNVLEMVEGNVVLARTRSKFLSFLFSLFFQLNPHALQVRKYPRYINDLAMHIGHPQLTELTQRFLFDQLHPNSEVSSNDIELELCPEITGKISVFHSAIATYFAPSDECGLRGMRRERIRSCPLWRKKAPRRDCALVVEDDDKPGMKGMNVVRIQLLFSFQHINKHYPCTLVEWFSTIGRSPDLTTGMWRVKPDVRRHGRLMSVIHLDAFLRGVHLLPIFGSDFLPINFDYTQTLDAFQAYYVNHFADHHAHEMIF